MKTTETLADGNQNVVFTNFAGNVMLRVYEDQTSRPVRSAGKRLRLPSTKYDSVGRVVLTAHSVGVCPGRQREISMTKHITTCLHDQGGGDYEYLGGRLRADRPL